MGMGCSGRSFAVEGSRRGKPLKSRVANFWEKKGTLLLGFSGCGKKQVICMGCSGRSFAVEGSRRGKPLKSFEVFRLWEWDVVAGVLL